MRSSVTNFLRSFRNFSQQVTLALPADTDTPGFAEEEKTKPKETKIISGSGGLANPQDVAIQIVNDALVIIT